MIAGAARLLAHVLCTTWLAVLPTLATAQEPAGLDLALPGMTGFTQPADIAPAPTIVGGVRLVARLTESGSDISRGLVWRIFQPDISVDGKLPMIASAQGGTASFQLEPGSYLVHAAFGRAGATKRITVAEEVQTEMLVLDAGGLKLDARIAGGLNIPPKDLRFAVYEAQADSSGDRALVVPNVGPNTVVRLNSGIYHVVSNYGDVNAVIRSDIRVEAGKLTEARVEHRAAELTFKLVREAGGEAIADTSWSIVSESGDPVRESVGAYASMILAEGQYTAIAKNRERIYQRDFEVVPGQNLDVEVLTLDLAGSDDETMD